MTTLYELGQVQLPVETTSYTPVPHKEFVNEILEAADKKGFSMISNNFNSARGGNIMSGKLAFPRRRWEAGRGRCCRSRW